MFIRRGGYGGGYGSGRGISGRLIIGLIIAGIGIVSYMMKGERNPVTGEFQRVGMTQEQEIALGIRAAPQMVSQMGGVYSPQHDARAAIVAKIGHELVRTTEAGSSPYAQAFTFELVRDPKTVNAFALPGGKIFITAALFDRLENEAQLAGVLGHEIGHVIHRHSAEHMAKSDAWNMIVTGVAVGTSDRDNGQWATLITAAVSQATQTSYGRKDELESDSTGLRYMQKAGYDPTEMVKVMQILKAAGGGSGRAFNWMQTHPDPDVRIQKIKEYLSKEFPSGVPPDLKSGMPLRGGSTQLER